MLFQSFAGALLLSSLGQASYNGITTPAEDVCAAIRPTIKVTVTVTIDSSGRIQPDSAAEGNYGAGYKSVAKPVVDAAFAKTTGAEVPTWTKKYWSGGEENSDVPASTAPYGYPKYSKAADVTAISKNGYGGYTKAAAPSIASGKGYYADSYEDDDVTDGDYDVDDDEDCEDEDEEGEDGVYAASYTPKSYSRASSDSGTKAWSRYAASSSAIEPSGSYGAKSSSTLSSAPTSGASSKGSSASSSPVSSKTSSASLSSGSGKSSSAIPSPSSSKTSSAVSSLSTSKISSETSSSSSVVSSATSSLSSTITSLSSSLSSSTSSAVSSTSSAAPPPPCVPGGNRLINQGFASGELAPWTTTPILVPPNDASIASTGISQDSDARIFSASFNGPRLTNDGIILSQANLDIPDGTVVSCRAWAYDFRSDGGASTYTIDIDGTICGSSNLPGQGWRQFGGDVLVTGDTHTVSITLQTNGVVGTNGAGLLIDNVEVTPIILPEGRSFCPV